MSGGVSFEARASAAASSGPKSSSQRAAIQPGIESACVRCASGSSASDGIGSATCSAASRRSTAFTSPVARSTPAARTQRTDSSTAAVAGTRSEKSSW